MDTAASTQTVTVYLKKRKFRLFLRVEKSILAIKLVENNGSFARKETPRSNR